MPQPTSEQPQMKKLRPSVTKPMLGLTKHYTMLDVSWQKRKNVRSKLVVMPTLRCVTSNCWSKLPKQCVTSSKVTETATLFQRIAYSTISLKNLVMTRRGKHSNPRVNNPDAWLNKGKLLLAIMLRPSGEKLQSSL